MALPDRANPYGFEEFLEKLRGFDFYADDPFLQRAVAHFAAPSEPGLHEKLLAFSPGVSFRLAPLADAISRPEMQPRLENFDAHNHRVDRILRPGQALDLEREIFGMGLLSSRVGPWESFVKRLILQQIGEAGVMCPIVCTEGLIALIEAFPADQTPGVKAILEHCKEGRDGSFGVGAQFMSEIQGGSDIPANLLEAQPDGDVYRLYGAKFFCSAMQADYAVVTAKVTGSEEVGVFVAPSWLPGDKERERRNGYRINRLKRKMGTSELPTAELVYEGALAYPVGPTDRGVANAVGIVLTLSRITVAMSSAGFMQRAAREALLYAEFREAFGRKVAAFPLAAHQVKSLLDRARRTMAGAFKVYQLFNGLGGKLTAGLAGLPEAEKRARFNLREIIIIQKLVTAFETVDVVRTAMSIFGGHGVIEDFSSLPRLLRDAAVNELWEGPKNVLLTQVFRDLGRVASWYPPAEFAASLLEGAPQGTVSELGRDLADLLAHPPRDLSPESLNRAREFEDLIHRMFKVYQDLALEEMGGAPLVRPELLQMPRLWE